MSHRNEARAKTPDERVSWWSSSSTSCSELNPMPDQIAKALVQLSFKNLQERHGNLEADLFSAQEAWVFYYYYLNLLERALLQFMTIALYTALEASLAHL